MFEHILKANPYRGVGGRYTSKDKAIRVTTFDEDMAAQQKWLSDKARENGQPTIDDLFAKDMGLYLQLATQWRRTHTFKGLNVRAIL